MNNHGSGKGSGGSPSSIVGYGAVGVQLDLLPAESLANLRVEQDDHGKFVTGLTVGNVPVRVRLGDVVQIVEEPLQQTLRDLQHLQGMQRPGESGDEWLQAGITAKTTALADISQCLANAVAAANPALNVYSANGRGFEIRLSQSNCTKPPTLRFFAAGVSVPPEMAGFPPYLPAPRHTDAIHHAWDVAGNQLLVIAVCGRLQGGEQKGSLSLFVQGGGQVFQVEADANHSGLRIRSGIVGEAIAPPHVVG
ncbi:MAG: hypothetical protein WC675_00360 [Patescibacteria group bacterium]|jgi:hypothetical protein